MISTTQQQQFGERLADRMSLVKLSPETLGRMIDVPAETVQGWIDSGPDDSLNVAKLDRLARALGTTIAALVPDPDDDLDLGVTFQRPGDNESRQTVRGGVDYYGFQCLARTRTMPAFIPLVVDVLVDDPKDVQLNHGHASHEFIYVMEGEIEARWGDPANPRLEVLPTGSSLYIKPDVPHSWTATPGSGRAKLLAVNF